MIPAVDHSELKPALVGRESELGLLHENSFRAGAAERAYRLAHPDVVGPHRCLLNLLVNSC